MHRAKTGAAALFLLVAASLSAQPALFQNNKKAALYVGLPAPVIDGDATDWAGLEGTSPEKWTFGEAKAERDPSGVFWLRADDKNLYILAEVIDGEANENELPAPLAWRNDSVEVYLGVGDATHNKYIVGDNQIRLVPVSRSEKNKMGAAVNDRVVENEAGVAGAVVYTARGYRIEAALPLRLLRLKPFAPGQSLRAEFQINDATSGERENMLHWSSPKDNTYFDPSSWGDGVVVTLSEATR
jgi:hypothetical protein